MSSYNESFEQDIRCALKRSTELGSVLLIVYDALTDEEEKILHKLTKDCFGVVLSSMDSIQENIKVCEEIRKLM